MSGGRSLNVTETVTPILEKIQATLAERAEILGSVGAAIQNLSREWVISQQPDRHETAQALGGDPTGFLGYAAEAIQVDPPSADEVTVNYNHPWFARVGGPVDIEPGEGHKYLAIPVAGEAYGKRLQGNFPGGFFFNTKNGGLFYGMKIPGHEHLLSPLYVLVTSVHQEQDRSRLPDDGTFQTTINETLQDELTQRIEALEPA